MKKLYFYGENVEYGLRYEFDIEIFNEGERKYIDDNEMDKIINDTSDKIKDLNFIKELENIGVYVNLEFEVDKGIYSDC